jgi:7-carboxy-7-deazaguanine synthase
MRRVKRLTRSAHARETKRVTGVRRVKRAMRIKPVKRVRHVTRVRRAGLPAGRRQRGAVRVKGFVSEIFASVQGEGIYVGERQVFVRVAGCSATCSWCDTLSSKVRPPTCVVYAAKKRWLANPISVDQTVSEVLSIVEHNGPIRTVSLTGGEPLEQADFVGGVAASLKRHGCRIYLDTNGLEPDAIGKVIDHVDVVAVDIKLPSATGGVHWEVHRAFLRALGDTEVFVKIVVDHSTPMAELEEAVTLIGEYNRAVPMVLQPEGATLLQAAHGAAARRRLLDTLQRTQRQALERLDDVRIIPQCHKLLQVR